MGTISLSLPSDGQTIDASDVNNPFNTIANEINGNLSNANIASNAAIDRSKISGFTDGWESLGYTPSTVTCNGNRSYDLTFSSVDLTGNISKGMRLKLTRTVTAPTGSITLNGTTQYANKTSPSGMTFTDDFVVSAWVKLTSYAGNTAIASRYNGTSGWIFFINSSGQVALQGFNAGAGNNSNVISYQSVPLNKWVHVSAQLDMSTFTATTTTSYIMIDGVNAPASVARAGTNPTALVQAGNLEIGSYNGGSNFFPGQIAQVAIYSAKVTQATILASMNQTLTGSETSLVSAYKLDQASGLNDLSANANNLTAQGSPTYSTTQTPFTQDVTGTSVTAGTTNYAIITKASFSTNTTLTVQIPEGETLPTSGGISAVSYSTQKIPYGFPIDVGKWEIVVLNKTLATQLTPTTATWYNVGTQYMNVPIGTFNIFYEASSQVGSGAGTSIEISVTLSTSSSSESDKDLTSACIGANAAIATGAPHRKTKYITTTSATTYYLLEKATGSSLSNMYFRGDYGTTIISATLAYL